MELKIINHYKLDLDNIKQIAIETQFYHKIYEDFNSIEGETLIELAQEFGIDKVSSTRTRLSLKHKLVVSILNGELASFCFFGDMKFEFNYFKLNENEIYFYDCFTFKEFRGLSAVYSEVRFVLERYKDRGYKFAYVEIETKNKNSQKAFEKLGFKKEKTFISFSCLNLKFIFP